MPDLRTVTTCIILLLVILLQACAHSAANQDSTPAKKNFNIKSLAKSDIDQVLDVHVKEMRKYLRKLMIKLYKRNPRELRKNRLKTAQENIVRVFDLEHDWNFPELSGKKNVEALQLTFDNNYSGDRVFSFIVGLTSMVMASYEYKKAFYILDKIDPQKLYNSARNIEIAAWKLKNNLDPNNKLYLYSNSLPGEEINISYERLFGKMIATQDNMAIIIADKNNRIIRKVIQRMATTAVFLPI